MSARAQPAPSEARLRSRLAFNSGVLVGGNLLGRLLSLVTVPLVARYLGPEAFGTYSLVLVYVGIFSVFSGVAINQIVVRDLARRSEASAEVLGNAILLRLLLGLGAMVACIGGSFVAGYPTDVQLLVGLYSITLVLSFSGVYTAPLTAAQSMASQTAVKVGAQLAAVILTVAIVLLQRSMIDLILVQVVTAVLTAAGFVVLFRYQQYVRPRYVSRIRLWRYLLREALPVAVSGLLVVMVHRSAILLLLWLQDETAVGFYSAAFRLTEALTVVAMGVTGAIYPAVSGLQSRMNDASTSLIRASVKLLLVIILPIAVGVTLLASEITVAIFSTRYLPAAPALVWLVWGEVFVFLNYLFGSLGTAVGRQRRVTAILAAATVSNLALNLAIIPRAGLVGAAMVMFATQGLILCLYFVSFGCLFKLETLWRELISVLCAAVGMGLLITALRVWAPEVWFLIPAGALGYGLMLLALRVITVGELRQVVARKVET